VSELELKTREEKKLEEGISIKKEKKMGKK